MPLILYPYPISIEKEAQGVPKNGMYKIFDKSPLKIRVVNIFDFWFFF